MRICPECDKKTAEMSCPDCRVATMASLTGDPMLGQRIGTQYQIESVLGRGGMGVVYRGIQLSMDRPVAIKVISPALVQDAAVVKRFQREAKLTSKLTHPNSIRVYDFGLTEDGVPYLVMEILEGRELIHEMRQVRKMPLDRAVSITTQVLKALGEAHGLGIVHRDLKPANIFLQTLGEEDVVKVMDFGIAKVVRGDGEASNQNLTQTGLLVGTPQYMSPEQIKGETVDNRSDIYSLGIILYQMLAGQVPFTSESPIAVMMKHTQDPVPPIGMFRPELANNAALKEVLDRFLAKKPEDRPVSALHAIALLQKVAPASVAVAPSEPLGLDTAGYRRLDESRRSSMPNPMTPSPDGRFVAALVPPTQDLPARTRSKDKVPASASPATQTVDADQLVEASHAAAEPPEDTDEQDLPAASRMGLAAGLAGLLGVLAAGATFMMIKRPDAPPAALVQPEAPQPTPAVAAQPTPPPTAPAAGTVQLAVRSTPPGADILVDGKAVGRAPLDVPVSKGAPITIRAELAGHAAVETKVVPQANQPVDLALERVGEKPSGDDVQQKPAVKTPPKKKPDAPANKAPPAKKKKSNDADLLEEM